MDVFQRCDIPRLYLTTSVPNSFLIFLDSLRWPVLTLLIGLLPFCHLKMTKTLTEVLNQ